MGYALLSARKILLTSRINQFNFALQRISEQRLELHKYGTSLSDGYLSLDEMAGMPMSLRPFALQYAMQGHMGAMYGAMQDAQSMFNTYAFGPNGQQFQQFAAQQPNIMNTLFQQALKPRLAEARKAEEARIHVIENELDMKQKKIETQLKAAEQEIQSVEKGEEAAIGRATPKYA